MDITEPVQLALVVAVPTFAAPIILLTINRILDRGDKVRQYAREDAVKKQVEAVAIQAKEAAELLRISTVESRTDAKEIKSQVLAVHTLVNSEKTASMESNLLALEGQLAALMRLEMMGRRLNPPVEATNEEILLIGTVRDRCKTLQTILKNRADEAKIVEAQLVRNGSLAANVQASKDERTAAATERVAVATERVAVATEAKKT